MGGFALLSRGQGNALDKKGAPTLFSQFDGPQLFKLCDANGDGFISRAELKTVLASQRCANSVPFFSSIFSQNARCSKVKVSEQDFRILWDALDSNKDDRISLEEFSQAMAWMRAVQLNDERPQETEEDKLRALRIYTHNLLKSVVETSQRAADKNLIKTAHACIDIIEDDALLRIEELVGKLVSDGERARIAKLRSLSEPK